MEKTPHYDFVVISGTTFRRVDPWSDEGTTFIHETNEFRIENKDLPREFFDYLMRRTNTSPVFSTDIITCRNSDYEFSLS